MVWRQFKKQKTLDLCRMFQRTWFLLDQNPHEDWKEWWSPNQKCKEYEQYGSEFYLSKKGYDLGFTSSNRHHHSVTVVEMKPDKSSLPTCLRLNGNFSMQGRLNSTSLSSPQFWQVWIFLLHMVERCHKLDPKVRSQYESELLWHRIWGPCLLQFPASSSASFASSRALPACTCLMRWHPNSCHHETKEEIISDCCTSHERFLRKIGAKIDDGISWEASEVGLRVLKIRRKFQRRESSFCF